MLKVKTDCRYFRGDVPCLPHKKYGVHCESCNYYKPVDKRILIIKLGALGDVIRTTPILRKLKEVYPESEIWWITRFPEILPDVVDFKLSFDLENILTLQKTRFDFLFNLDKDREACALADMVEAEVKKGFTLKNGRCAPFDSDAEHKFMTGIFDDVSKLNRKSYPEEIFEICGFKFNGERYILDNFAGDGYSWNFDKSKKIVGLNTGCGDRWVSRLWPDKYWVELAVKLKEAGFFPIFLGGEKEHEKNLELSKQSGCHYPGHFPLRQFINLVDQCDLVVTTVTMALHIAIGLGKKVVLLNNIFNKYEFELYGLGEIVEPERPCKCFYSPVCVNPEYRCMDYLSVESVFNACVRLLSTNLTEVK